MIASSSYVQLLLHVSSRSIDFSLTSQLAACSSTWCSQYLVYNKAQYSVLFKVQEMHFSLISESENYEYFQNILINNNKNQLNQL